MTLISSFATSKARAAAIVKSAHNDEKIAAREQEIAAVQRDLDTALEAARQAKLLLDQATKRAQLAALRDIGVIAEDDGFSDEPPEGCQRAND